MEGGRIAGKIVGSEIRPVEVSEADYNSCCCCNKIKWTWQAYSGQNCTGDLDGPLHTECTGTQGPMPYPEGCHNFAPPSGSWQIAILGYYLDDMCTAGQECEVPI